MKVHLYKRVGKNKVTMLKTACNMFVAAGGLKSNNSREAYFAYKSKSFKNEFEKNPSACCVNCVAKAKKEGRL